MSCGSLLILVFFLMSDVICPVPRTYISLLKNKKAFKQASRASFGIAKWFYLFQIDQLPQKRRVTCTISGTCHHETNLA